jgi:serine/threonine-protein kinase
MPLTEIGYYRIDRLLGEGGMGSVYAATHRMTGRPAAVKTLRAELAQRADLNARFFNEARTISYLDHPGIVRIMDVGRTPDGAAYMVMEYCEGPTLGEAMRSSPRPEVRLSLLRQVAEAVAYAHAQGVVHRDLKPDNVIVAGSFGSIQPKVLDFGIAKVLDGAVADGSPFAVKTRTGTAMGTPLYMSPEQCRGVGGVTQATDVYSFGIMLFEAITGKVPFNGGVGEVIVQHLTTPSPELTWPAQDTLVDARAALSALVRATLEKDAASRPSMADVVEALADYAPFRSELPPTALYNIQPIDPLPSFTAPPVVVNVNRSDLVPPARRSRVLPFALGASVVIIGIGAVALRAPSRRDPAPAQAAPVAAPAAPQPSPPAAPAVSWQIDSQPSGADVASTAGHILGRTPYDATDDLHRGERQVFLRKSGYFDELVNYDGQALSSIALRPRPAKKGASQHLPSAKPTPVAPSASPVNDTFDVKPLH